MIKNILFLFLAFSIFGCKGYVQVFETKSDNLNTIDETYIYESDSLKITYNLWREKGLMQFEIYNKLNVPIYVDWRKSSYIDNTIKLNYWEDVERTSALYLGYYYQSAFIGRRSAGISNSTKTKDERITFIPPKAKYSRSQFYIIPKSFTVLGKNGPSTEVILKEGSNKTTKVFYKEYNKKDTPRVFRNFLSFSLTEDFKNEFYVDNEFYISKILEMEQGNFYGNRARYTRPSDEAESLPYKDNRYFYINVGEQKIGAKTKRVRKVDFKD